MKLLSVLQNTDQRGEGKDFSKDKRSLLRIMTSVLFGLAVTCMYQALAPTTASALPAGFSVRDMPSGQAQLLTDFSFTPDGGYFTASKNGRIAWVSATGQARTIADLPTVATQDLGLNAVTVAHDYAASKKLYTIRSLTVNTQTVMRLSSWTVVGSPTPTSLSAEKTIIEIPSMYPVHGMTTVLAPSDGTLWVSIGDSSDYHGVDPRAFKALDINEGYGKVLHILPNGNGVTTNPYYSSAAPGSWKSRVYASGFRSPFRMSLDPATGAPVLGDVGYNTYEEINIVRPGASYGWPCWEGNSKTPGYTDSAACTGVGNSKPLHTYVHGPLGTSVTGGIVYGGSAYPAAYRGSYFFGDYSSRRTYTLKYDAAGVLTRQPETGGFGVDKGLPVKFDAAANGDILYADIGGSVIKRVVYAAGNRAPTAKATITNVASTRTVTFDASQSSDLDGDALTYSWDFGDGTKGSGVRVSHTYAAPGTTPLTAKLTVTDTQGAAGTATYTVVPANATPKLTMTTPPAGTVFKVDEPVNLSAKATDPEDGDLTVNWRVVLVHCSGGYCHDHPGESLTGPTFNKPFQDHGDNTRMEITASATDKTGAVAQTTYIAQPKLRTLTVASNVPSAVTVNGVARNTVEVTVGAHVSLVAPVSASDGVATFDRWTDGAPRERVMTMPDADTTLGVSYLTPIDRRYASEATLRTTLGTPTAPEAGDTSLRYRQYTNGRLYWTPRSGVHEIHGGIYRSYLAAGAHVVLGEPTTDEVALSDGKGHYNEFYGSPGTGQVAIYWTSATGAHRLQGSIYQLWKSMGAHLSTHGYPTSSELAAAKSGGRYVSFQKGRIYWSPSTGTRSVNGAIYAKWAALKLEAGFLGLPITSELKTADGVGRYNNFQGGSVYWSPRSGAYEVHGGIRGRWISLGAEKSYLGYPTSDEYAISGGRRSNFQNGYITWTASTGQITDRRY